MSEAVNFNLRHPILPMGNDTAGIELINPGTAILFEHAFKSHFKSLHAYACSILKEETIAEEMVQNVFFKLWEKKEQIQVNQSVTAYLYRAVYNECLNYLKHNKVKAAHRAHAVYTGREHENTTDPAVVKELELHIDQALNELPEQCRTIFQMSRYEELKYRMIADQLGISVKTVENQMGKALRLLRQKLAGFLPAFLLLFINLLK